MVAPERVMLLAETPAANGSVWVGVLVRVPVALGATVGGASAGRVGVDVGNLVGTLVRVGARVEVGVGGSMTSLAMIDAVGVAAGVGELEAVGAGVRRTVGDGVGLDVGVTPAD